MGPSVGVAKSEDPDDTCTTRSATMLRSKYEFKIIERAKSARLACETWTPAFRGLLQSLL
jgi:hypothetical protein